MVRGTMLYDTLAARLNPDLDIHQEYKHFRVDAGIEARDHIKDGFVDRLRHGGLTPEDYLRLEQLMNEGEQIVFQARRALHDVHYNIAPLVTRLASAIGLLYSVGFRMLMVWGLPFFIAYLYYYIRFFFALPPEERSLPSIAQLAWQSGSTVVLNSNLYWTFAFSITLLILIVMGRRLMSRLYQLGNDN
jgi:hypothetical protein